MPAKCCSRHYPISFTLSPTPISLLLPMRLKDILVVSKNIIDDIEDYLLSIGKAIFCGIFTSYPNKIATQNEYYTHPEQSRDGLLRRAPLAQDEPSRLRRRTRVYFKIQYLFLGAAQTLWFSHFYAGLPLQHLNDCGVVLMPEPGRSCVR